MRFALFLFAGPFLASSAAATDLNWSVQSGGTTTLQVLPGEPIAFEVWAELSDADHLGLGGFSFDLAFDGGALTALAVPAAAPMNAFASPLGLNNPAGFGGTPDGGKLLQIGGIQNTIANFLALPPMGVVELNVATLGTGQVLATGTLSAPLDAGTYTLAIENPLANVIRAGETGAPFWACDEAPAGTVDGLVIEVEPYFSSNLDQLSLAGGGTQLLFANAGSAQAGRAFLVLGSLSGTSPGITVPPVTLPLNLDFYTLITLMGPNLPPLTNSFGLLDGSGKATAAFTLPTGLGASFIGVELNHAFVLLAPEDFASNAVSLELLP